MTMLGSSSASTPLARNTKNLCSASARFLLPTALRASAPPNRSKNTRMSVPFVKAQACGNDFILVDSRHVPENVAGFTHAICDRHFGVGADGVEIIYSDPQIDARIRLINADGSEAELSGNGTRCVAAYLISERGGALSPFAPVPASRFALSPREPASNLNSRWIWDSPRSASPPPFNSPRES